MGTLEEPNAHFKAEVRTRQRADWTNINRVERVVMRKLFTRVAGKCGIGAAVYEAEHVIVGDFFAETNTA